MPTPRPGSEVSSKRGRGGVGGGARGAFFSRLLVVARVLSLWKDFAVFSPYDLVERVRNIGVKD